MNTPLPPKDLTEMFDAHSYFDKLLSNAVAERASDVHLSCCRYSIWRINGYLSQADEHLWKVNEFENLINSLLSHQQQSDFAEKGTVDLGYTSATKERYRINVFRALGLPCLVARHLPSRFSTFAELRLPESLQKLSELTSGMVLVTGVTGSGKSTTLATLINEINHNAAVHILTVEDPVEFVHPPKKAVITHRELHTDVNDFSSAVKAALREDPDVILVGELRDTETMRAALTASETGHLVFSTLHTADAAGTIERFVGGFDGPEQSVVRHRLSLVLKAVVAQQLMPTIDGTGRVAVCEILIVTPAVSNLIASGRTNQIYSAMEGGREIGMQTFDQALANRTREKLVHPEDARRLARDPITFDRLVKQPLLGSRSGST